MKVFRTAAVVAFALAGVGGQALAAPSSNGRSPAVQAPPATLTALRPAAPAATLRPAPAPLRPAPARPASPAPLRPAAPPARPTPAVLLRPVAVAPVGRSAVWLPGKPRR